MLLSEQVENECLMIFWTRLCFKQGDIKTRVKGDFAAVAWKDKQKRVDKYPLSSGSR
jgi:hypothetical protein